MLVEEGGLWLFVEKMSFDRFSFTVFGFDFSGKLIAKLLLAVIVVILNYFFSKFIIFAKRKQKKIKSGEDAASPFLIFITLCIPWPRIFKPFIAVVFAKGQRSEVFFKFCL